MESIFVQLKKARESKALSIADIASATLINSDLLQAIENGRTDILPQAYVRAFLREYAAVVGLDPAEVLRQYDGRETPPATSESPSHTQQRPAASPAPLQQEPPPTTTRRSSRKHLTYVVMLAGCLLVGIVYWNLSRTRTVPEVSTAKSTVAPPTSFPTPDLERTKVPPVQSDTLTLLATTSDTVWVKIVVDGVDTLEYLMRPGTRRSWKAKTDFLVSVGRPDRIEFTLNGKKIGRLGKPGGIVVEKKIDRRSLAD